MSACSMMGIPAEKIGGVAGVMLTFRMLGASSGTTVVSAIFMQFFTVNIRGAFSGDHAQIVLDTAEIRSIYAVLNPEGHPQNQIVLFTLF